MSLQATGPANADLRKLAEEERALEFTAPRRTRPWRVVLAFLLTPVVFWLPLEILLLVVGALFTESDFLAPLDENLRTLEMSEGELYRPKPGNYPDYLAGFRINTLGFRGPDIGDKAPGEYRVLALGDSTIFGLYVEEQYAWPSVAERELRDAGYAVDFVNMGRVATSSFGTRFDLENHAADLDPDALVISVGWFNDYQIIHEHPDWDERRAVDEEMFREEWDAAHSPLQMSRVYRIWRSWWWKEYNRRNQQLTREWIEGGRYEPEAAEETRRVPIDQFEENLRAMCAWAKKRDLPVFFMTPALNPTDEETYPIVRRYADAVEEVGEECGATLIPSRQLLLDLAAEYDVNPKEIWLDYVHLNRVGNRYVAELVADELQAHLELPWEEDAQP